MHAFVAQLFTLPETEAIDCSHDEASTTLQPWSKPCGKPCSAVDDTCDDDCLESYLSRCDRRCTRDDPVEWTEPCTDDAKDVASNEHFQGLVHLSTRLKASEGAMTPSMCCIDGTDLVLLGGTDWRTTFVKLPLHNLSAAVHPDEPCCFSLNIQGSSSNGDDMRIFLFVDSIDARDRWLSALSVYKVLAHGWDAAVYYRPLGPAICKHATPGLHVIWLS